MKQLLIFAIIIGLAVGTGCGTKPDNTDVNGSTVKMPIDVNKLSPNPSPAINTSQPITAPTIATPVNMPVQSQVTSNSSGLNPAHGQPGHRCDIAVGAPLNSAPATTTTVNPANQNQVITTSAPATTTPVKVAAGMNPSHGQPGHRCDIAVGAPLNSTPNANTTSVTTTSNPTSTPSVNSNVTPGSIKPTIINSTPGISTATTTSTPVNVAPGMNPSHGQPGHRCDIAVGAPLNSAPETKKQ